MKTTRYAEDAANAGMEGWKVTAIAIDVVAVLVLAALDLTVIRKQYKKRKQATAPQKEQ